MYDTEYRDRRYSLQPQPTKEPTRRVWAQFAGRRMAEQRGWSWGFLWQHLLVPWVLARNDTNRTDGQAVTGSLGAAGDLNMHEVVYTAHTYTSQSSYCL